MSNANRLNMSFTNYRARNIHRDNHILMHKLIAAKSHIDITPPFLFPPREPSSAVNRRKNQEKMNRENMVCESKGVYCPLRFELVKNLFEMFQILLRKIQEAKSSGANKRKMY